jgi:hypothetical protein
VGCLERRLKRPTGRDTSFTRAETEEGKAPIGRLSWIFR